MRIPPTPPDWRAGLAAMEPARAAALVTSPSLPDDYQPWDKIRYREPPTGMSHEEWWIKLKLGRMATFTLSLIHI